MKTVKDIATRNLIPAVQRVDGDAVHVLNVGVFFLRGGITNSHWEGPDKWATIADMKIYVDPAGDDDTGTGAVGAPYATIKRAYKDVPYTLRHAVQVHIATGTYTDDWPARIENKIEGTGQLVFDGIDGLSDDEGTLTSALTTTIADAYAGYIILEATVQVGGAPGWTANEHRGKFIKVLTGTNAGGIAAIVGNTADTLTVHAGHLTLPDTADTFTIGTPLAKVTISSTINFNVGPEVYTRDTSIPIPFGIGFIDIDTSTTTQSFVFDRTKLLIQASRLISSTVNCTAYCNDSDFSHFELVQPAKGFTVSSTIDINDVIWFFRGYWYLSGSSLGGAIFYTRGEFRSSFSGGTEVDFIRCRAQKLEFWSPVTCIANACVFDGGSAYECLDLRYLCKVSVSSSYFRDGTDILYIREEATVNLANNTQAAAAGFTKYGIDLDGLARVVIAAGDVPVGNLGSIYFRQIDSVSPAPVAGASVTDGQGSIVVNRRA